MIARHPSYLPYLKQHLTAESVAEYFSHYFESAEDSSAAAADKVTRFDVPGINALNFLLEDVLDGGGIASMRPDPLGKAFAQMLLDFKMEGMPSKDQIEKDF